MDQEIVLDAIKKLFRERAIMMSETEIPKLYVWGLSVRVDDEIAFSIDLHEWYVQKMISAVGKKEFQEVLTKHIYAEIQENLNGGQTYTEKTRTLH